MSARRGLPEGLRARREQAARIDTYQPDDSLIDDPQDGSDQNEDEDAGTPGGDVGQGITAHRQKPKRVQQADNEDDELKRKKVRLLPYSTQLKEATYDRLYRYIEQEGYKVNAFTDLAINRELDRRGAPN